MKTIADKYEVLGRKQGRRGVYKNQKSHPELSISNHGGRWLTEDNGEDVTHIIHDHEKLIDLAIRTEKGKAELERSKKAEELRKQGKTTDMFKAMFGQAI